MDIDKTDCENIGNIILQNPAKSIKIALAFEGKKKMIAINIDKVKNNIRVIDPF